MITAFEPLETDVTTLLVENKAVSEVTEGQEVTILVDKTCFYAESGGQVADHGYISTGNVRHLTNVVTILYSIFPNKCNIRATLSTKEKIGL